MYSICGPAHGAEGTVAIPDVVLWQPGKGYLYSLVAEVRGGGRLVDSYSQPFGVHTIEVRGKQFLINGGPFYFMGFGMHEDHVTVGKGHSAEHMVNDFQLLDWVGDNSFRTSHYPYAEEVTDFADRRPKAAAHTLRRRWTGLRDRNAGSESAYATSPTLPARSQRRNKEITMLTTTETTIMETQGM
ncbi:glycoside hydrolase family 2 TIM barrel-domain containing protein [Arthrobacter sp. ISL-30]|uniref:glycoside hydrolase family 2 TIM barrel-domain containing protein n=1 Tax=Arthrobacter sp. ISL-30 TaxID=2819109 RepID=UPI002034DFBC|nr:glycoside hydrolase family 2 TIM barrel-domain containing protein [Arthrobacter sp. ISL-30]